MPLTVAIGIPPAARAGSWRLNAGDVDVDVTVGIVDGAVDQAQANGKVDDHQSNPGQYQQHVVHHRKDVAAEGIGTTVLGAAVLPSSIVVRGLEYNH